MKRAIVVCAWLAVTLLPVHSASAQSPDAVPIPAQGDRGLKAAIIAWTAGVAADQITTYRFSSQYRDLLHEQNPLLRGLDRHPVLLVAAGSAIDAATAWAAYRLLGPRHPRLAKIAFYGAAAYRSYLASYNLQMMRRAEQIRAATLP